MMGFVGRGDNSKCGMRLAKRFTGFLLAAFISIGTAVTPYAQDLSDDTEPIPAVTLASEDSGDVPAVNDTADVPGQTTPDVTDITVTDDAPSDTIDIPVDSGELSTEISDVIAEKINPDDSFIDEDGVVYFVLTRAANGGVTCTVGVNSSGYFTLFVEGSVDVPGDVTSAIFDNPEIQPYKDLISKVQIQKGVTSIAENAFRGLPRLTEVKFTDDNAVKNISNGAFADCPLLTTVNLENCKSLISIGNTDNVSTADSYNDSANELRATGAFSNTGLTSIVIPQSLQQVGHCTFYNCVNLTDVVFEQNSQEIFTFGANVFEECKALKNINLEALRGNIYTKKIDRLEKYSQGLFHNCDSLESITVPQGFGYKGSPLVAMFNDCDKLTSITFEENHNITGVDNQIDNIISGRTRSIEILDLRNLVNLTEIGKYSIRGDKLSVVYLPASVEKFDLEAFSDCKSLTTVVFPEGSRFTTLGNASFLRDDNITSVNLENTQVATICDYAFQHAYALTEITFPKTLLGIRLGAFDDCPALSKINYNAENLGSVGGNLFNGTSNINVHIEKDVRTISGDFLKEINGHAGEFTFEPNLEFTVSGNDDTLSGYDTPFKTAGTYKTDADGNLYKVDGSDKTLVMANKSSAGTFSIPADVTGIGEYAFRGCSGITTINFENIDVIKTLQEYAFADCENLESLTADGLTFENIKAKLEGLCSGDKSTLFVNTKLPGSSSGGGESFEGTPVTGQYIFNKELELSANKYYPTDTLLTDQDWTVHANVSNDNSGNTYRLYVKCENGCILPDASAETCQGPNSTDEPNIFYYNIKAGDTGATVQHNIVISYPNGTAPGQNVQVWAVKGNKESFDNLGNKVVYPNENVGKDIKADSKYLQMEWTTVPNTHNVTKKIREGSTPSFAVRNNQTTLTNLCYDIELTFNGADTSSAGADNSIAAEYRDAITIPEPLKWMGGLQQAVESGNYRFTITNGYTKTATVYATIGSTEYEVCSIALDNAQTLNLTGVRLEWKENAPEIIWQVKSQNKAQLPVLKTQLNIGDVIVGGVGFEGLATDTALTIDNKVNTTVSHQFSADDHNSAECSVTVQKSPAKLSLSKNMLNDPRYLGEDVKYRITLENNTSVTATARDLSNNNDALVLHDGLYPKNAGQVITQYIKPENIEEMFNAEDGEYLRIEISAAVLTNMNIGENTTVTTVDGEETVILTPSNTANVTNDYSIANNSTEFPQVKNSSRMCKDDENVITRDAVITIENAGDGIKVTVIYNGETKEYTTAEGKTLKNIFDEIGYIVTRESKYDLYWTYPADYTFEAGMSKEIEYTATVKNTFMSTPYDNYLYYNYSAENDKAEAYNFAEIENPAGEKYTESSAEVSKADLKKDLQVGKGLSINGNEVKNDKDLSISNNDEIEYDLKIDHSGTGQYDVLPCVDSMVGAQVLLAEVEKNEKNLADCNLPTYTYKSDDGEVECYVLNVPGTYKNVWLGDFCASSVTVQAPDNDEPEGLKTVIKWYFKDTIPQDFEMHVRYKALVSVELSGVSSESTNFSLENSVWLNDHPEHRIYDYVGIIGSVVTFNKTAIKKVNESEGVDKDLVGEEQHFCNVGIGDEITYRLDFTISGNDEQILTNESIFDVLPSTGGQFEWSKKNVQISYGSNNNLVSIEYQNGDLATDLITSSTGEEWEIIQKDGLYRINWKDGFKITLGKPDQNSDTISDRTAYIDVTLSFPSKSDEWENYYNAIGGKDIINTLNCNKLTANVRHTLSGTCQAFIQKGVYETGSFSVHGVNRYKMSYYRGADRVHYATNPENNNGFTENYVTYYIVIANTGKTNLYLAPIYDILPEGFEFYSLCSAAEMIGWDYVGRNEQTLEVQCCSGGVGNKSKMLIPSLTNDEIDEIKLNNHSVSATPLSNIGNHQVIQLDVVSGYWPEEHVKEDEQKRKYLEPNHYIQFGITCKTSSERIDPADNIVVMEYLDYTDSKLVVDRDDPNTVDTIEGTKVHVNTYNGLNENDGDRLVFEDAELEELLGGQLDHVQTDKEDIQWLASSVDVYPGDIKPGIEKTTEPQLYKVTNGNIEPQEGVVWTVKSHNDGTEGITNYKIVDTLDYPLRFEGAFRYQVEFKDEPIYASGNMNGNMSGNKWVMMGNSYYNTKKLEPMDDEKRWINLFTIERSNSDDSMTIWSNKLKDSGEKFDPITLKPNTSGKLNVRLMHRGEGHVERDINIRFEITPVTGSDGKTYNQETLIVTFADEVFTIVPDGVSLFDVSSTLNPKAPEQDKIGTFNNTAYLIPTQEFETTAPYGERTDYLGEEAVENFAQITTYSESPTSSYKKIEEVGVDTNCGYSNRPLNNKIFVDSADKNVKYTLTVVNGKDAKPMKKLVLIDNLPDVGDTMTIQNTPRKSEFKVSLAEKPEFTVTVTHQNGQKETLTANSDFTVEYRLNTNYAKNNISQSPDWQGGNGDAWKANAAEARSFRVVITRQIQPGDTVEISFKAKIDGSAKPGQIAWNSFAYSFTTNDSSWLFAAPKEVGVGLPPLPDIQKRSVIKKDGELVDYNVKTDEVFSFFIYEGGPLETITDFSASGIKNALDTAGIKYAEFTLTVPADKAISDKLPLANITPLPEDWKWEINKDYTIIEAAHENYYVQSATQTFTYQRDSHTDIVIENILKKSIEITKVDSKNNNFLADAVFGLYSPVSNDQMSAQEITNKSKEYSLTGEVPTTIEMDGNTYYLYRIDKTGDNGIITFDKLSDEKYLIKELKAPDGYYVLPDESITVCNLASDEINKVTIENRTMAMLPETGGQGCVGIVTVGALLAILSAGAFAVITRRREYEEEI